MRYQSANAEAVLIESYTPKLKALVREVEEYVFDTPLNNKGNIGILFENINRKLSYGSFFKGQFYTNEYQKQRILQNRNFLSFLRYMFAFLKHRFLPKFTPFSRKLYLRLTRGKEKFLSKTEVLGRLYKYGFSIDEFQEENGICFFKARKVRPPDLSKDNIWPILKMKRIGSKGRLVTFYKLRTMHPYAEYLQEFIYLNYGLEGGDKFKNDFRITSWGRFLRKYWLDELPMLINLLKGDLKLIGPRPLTKHKFALYSKELQQLRTQFKPGLLPPFYADLPDTLAGMLESEKKYLVAYLKDGVRTDIRYFLLIVKNIFFRNARSK